MPPKIAHDRRVFRESKFRFTENLFFQKEFQYLLSIQIKCVAFLSKVPQDFGKVTGPENCSCFSFAISMIFFCVGQFHFIHRDWRFLEWICLHCSEEYPRYPFLAVEIKSLIRIPVVPGESGHRRQLGRAVVIIVSAVARSRAKFSH